MKKVFVIGGGIAGLIAAIRLAKSGFICFLAEKKTYPFHRVCGEYLSLETLPFLVRENLLPRTFRFPMINQFELSTVTGKKITMPLDLGGMGISRYAFDNYLYEHARACGVTVLTGTEIDDVTFQEDLFILRSGDTMYDADFVINAVGKRSKLDIITKRSYIRKRSPFVGVKYHVRLDHPEELIALHNFPGGYCGVSNVEEGRTNVCYLTHRDPLKKHGNLQDFERNVVWQNPLLASIFQRAEHLFERPETVNEVSFQTKEPVWDHQLMIGDAAGMIAPLSGNGMALAVRSAKLVSDLLAEACSAHCDRAWIEKHYAREWRKQFAARLWFGRLVQNKLFGSEWSSSLALSLAVNLPFVANKIISNTHGDTF